MIALLDASVFVSACLAAGAVVALLARGLPCKPFVALGLTTVPALGMALVPVFC